MATGLILAAGAIHIGHLDWPLLYRGDVSSSQKLVSTVLASLVTLTTMLISITVVVLTLAASQLGPRLIRAFMGDNRTQQILGIFFGSIAYAVIVLAFMIGPQTPNLAVSMTAAMMLACIVAIFLFIHHLAKSIVADSVVQRVGKELDTVVVRSTSDQAAEPVVPPSGKSTAVSMEIAGYVQSIDYQSIAAWAEKNDCVVNLCFKPGDHLVLFRDDFHLFPPREEVLDAIQAMRAAVVVGGVRTPLQDVEFGVRQLVEIAQRALSPGINDPNTAIAVIDRLTASFMILFSRHALPPWVKDSAGTVRVMRPVVTFQKILFESFTQLRQASSGRSSIMTRLLTGLECCAAIADHPDKQAVIRLHGEAIMNAARRTVIDSYDLMTVETGYRRLMDQLNRAPRQRGRPMQE